MKLKNATGEFPLKIVSRPGSGDHPETTIIVATCDTAPVKNDVVIFPKGDEARVFNVTPIKGQESIAYMIEYVTPPTI